MKKKLIISDTLQTLARKRRLGERPGVFTVQSSMKKTHALTRLALLVSLAATMLLAGCATRKDAPRLGEAPPSVYETAEQIKAMPSCKAKVVERGPCYVYLKTTDGNGFYLGSPGSKADVYRFLAGLKDGEQYEFPDAFLKYQKKQPRTER